jgi:ATP-grasp ribosomal peptide maturase
MVSERTGGVVLVLTNRLDSTADLVVSDLNTRKVPVFRCDTAEFPTRLTLSAGLANGWAGKLDSDHRRLDLENVRSVYFRRPEEFQLSEELSEAGRLFAAAQSRAGFLGVIASLPCLWINHPSRDSNANYKPWQLAVARRLGLDPPRTIITNDPDAAREFAAHIGSPIITKSLGSAVDTVVVDPAEFDDSVRLCAHVFQEWVDKAYEVRLTVVGNTFHAVEIHASSERGRVDWRTDYDGLTYRVTTAPVGVRMRVARLMEYFGLVFGAFDFVVTPQGAWRFLEVNPNGQWQWLEDKAGVPISRSIAALLERGEIDA